MDLINPKWMAENTSVLFYELAQSLPLLWIHVPVGNANKEEAPKRLQSNIKTQYQQGSSNLCLLKSLASTLKYMKLESYAGLMNQIAPQYQFLPFTSAYKKIQEDMREKAPRVGNCMVFNNKGKNRKKKKNINKMSIDDLLNDKTKHPTIVIPLGNDRKVSHAFCVIDDLIFDSTQKFALKLCQASIDWICGDCGCKDIYVAVRFHEKYGDVDKFERKMIDHGFKMENNN